MERNFYKCPICLSVVAIDGKYVRDLTCDLCEKPMMHMGKVSGQKLIRTELLTPCDARCTGAEGPSCDCQCGGKNHGTKALVEVVYDAGGIPKVKPPDGDARKRREEYLAARAETNKRIEAAIGHDTLLRFKNREWIEGPEYWEARRLQDEYHHATALRSHKGRLRALDKIARSSSVGTIK